jgi:hypothetical protein
VQIQVQGKRRSVNPSADQVHLFVCLRNFSTGSWMMQTNDGAHSSNILWYYLGQDYDGSFGVYLTVDVLEFSYDKHYPDKCPEAVLIIGFLQNTDLRSRLKDTVKTLFNEETLGKRIKAFREFDLCIIF